MKKYDVLAVKADGELSKKPVMLVATEDTYVIDGDDESGENALKDKNFGDSDILHFKADAKTGKLYRRVLLKFDISKLAGEAIKKVSLRLFGVGAQDPNGCTVARFFALDENTWDEKTVTYNTVPEIGEYITSAAVGKSFNYIDLSDYVIKSCLRERSACP